jgi:hypothetical protein
MSGYYSPAGRNCGRCSCSSAQSHFLARDRGACDRHNALALGELNLHHHHGLLAERYLSRGEIESQAAPAASDVECALTGPRHELRGQMPLLGKLRGVE